MWLKRQALVVLAFFLALAFLSEAVSAADTQATNEATTRRTASTEEICENWTCTMTLYSSTRFVEENGSWIPIEEAKSLKGIWIPIYIEKDPAFSIELYDFNYTYADIRLNFTGDPLKYSECTYKSAAEYKCQFKVENKNNASQFKFDYKYEVKGGVEVANTYKFEYKGNPYGVPFKFGGNSTTVTLGSASRWEDALVCNNSATTNFGSLSRMNISGVADMNYTYGKFNISSLPDNITIDLAQLRFLMTTTVGYWYEVRHVYNQTWTEEEITYANQPCGENITDAVNCNLTAEVRVAPGGQSFAFESFSITNMVAIDYAAGNSNFSYVMNTSSPQNQVGTTEDGTGAVLLVTYTYYAEPRWYLNQSSIQSEYNPAFYPKFNITWNTTNMSAGNISSVWFESNYSGSAVNYSMSNATYGFSIFNYTIPVILAAGSYYWMSCANDTLSNYWNCTSAYVFTIPQNSTNPAHTNITIGGVPTTDSAVSSYSDVSITLGCYLGWTGSGTALLWVDGTQYTNPSTQTWGVGIYAVKCNTSGNGNYTSNSTGFSVSMTIATPPASGGGGTGGWTPPTPDCGSFRIEPEVGFSGSASLGEKILPFTARIWNGNVSQLFRLKEFTDGLAEHCTLVSQPDGKTPINGYAEIVFECVAPNGTAIGNVVIQTDTGCEESRPVGISNAIGFLADTADLLEKLAGGEFWSIFGIQTDAGGIRIPTMMIWLMIMIVVTIAVIIWI